MFILEQSARRKLQSRVDTKQNVLERTVSNPHTPSCHPQPRKPSPRPRTHPNSPVASSSCTIVSVVSRILSRSRSSSAMVGGRMVSRARECGDVGCGLRTRCRRRVCEGKVEVSHGHSVLLSRFLTRDAVTRQVGRDGHDACNLVRPILSRRSATLSTRITLVRPKR